MQNLDVQQALESLRQEIQTDRIAKEQAINLGFEKVLGKLDAHTDRIADLEAKQRTIIGVLTATSTAVFSGIVAWVFGK
jgi:hypothetical protein